MPKRDLQDVWGLLAELFQELGWPLRLGFFGGLAAGGVLGLYLVGLVPRGELRWGVGRAAVLVVIGLVMLGAFLGLFLGAVLDLAWKALFGRGEPPGKGKAKRKRGER
jgi:hypothetical protein